MSEPGAGTDVMGMSTSAKLSEDKSHYVLNGTKMWITNGTIDGTDTGDVYLVYAKTGQSTEANIVLLTRMAQCNNCIILSISQVILSIPT